MYLVDLPGYGYARVPLRVKKSWRCMVEDYLRKRSNLKSVVVILDIRREPTTGDMDLMNWLKHFGIRTILVLTKADKMSRQKALKQKMTVGEQFVELSPPPPVLFSAKTRQGREELWERINEAIGT
jgi:GTP-binding protein